MRAARLSEIECALYSTLELLHMRELGAGMGLARFVNDSVRIEAEAEAEALCIVV